MNTDGLQTFEGVVPMATVQLNNHKSSVFICVHPWLTILE